MDTKWENNLKNMQPRPPLHDLQGMLLVMEFKYPNIRVFWLMKGKKK